jgi:endonuclease YncB( thermonuclease family)
MHRVATLALLLLIAPVATATAETISGPMPATVDRVVDGDTLAVTIRIWLGQDVHVLVRVRGIDSPELRGRCADEKRRARLATVSAAEALGDGAVTLTRIEGDKYSGRVLADVRMADGRDLGSVMLASGTARRYDGSARGSWCAG